MLRKAKLFNAIIMISLLVGSVYSSKAEQWSVVSLATFNGSFSGLVLSDDGKLAAVACDVIGNYVPLNSGGSSIIPSACGNYYYYDNEGYGYRYSSYDGFEISNGYIAILGESNGNWVNLNESGSSENSFQARIDVSNGKIRFCMLSNCGDWIYLKTHTCPSGATYNSSTQRCEATPTITCPAGYTYNSSINKCQANPVTSCPAN